MNRRQGIRKSIPRDKSAQNLRARIREMARAAGFSGVPEAYAHLDRGELRGTMIEMNLEMLRFLDGANGQGAVKAKACT